MSLSVSERKFRNAERIASEFGADLNNKKIIMGAILGMAFVASVVVGSTYFLSKFLPNFNAGPKKVREDLAAMKKEMEALVATLVPWTEEEKVLLSLQNKTTNKKSGITKTISGQFDSIYHEPLIVWRMKEYAGGKLRKLIYARTSHQEFTYRVTAEGIDVAVGDYFIGIYKKDHILYEPNKGRPVAQIKRDAAKDYFPLFLEGKEIGNLANPLKAEKVNPRAFGLLTNMTEQEEAIFIALAIIEMMRIEYLD